MQRLDGDELAAFQMEKLDSVAVSERSAPLLLLAVLAGFLGEGGDYLCPLASQHEEV